MTVKALVSFRYIAGIILTLFLFISCKKSDEQNNFPKHNVNDPSMSAQNIEVLFSDSGRIEARLTSPLLNRYEGENPSMEFPKGFSVFMYDAQHRLTSTITGNRGIRRDNTRTMEAWGNVVVKNIIKNEQLNTEHLIWEENRHKIWSDVKVRITTPDKTLYGDRMESNEDFTDYSILNVTGQMTVQRDSL